MLSDTPRRHFVLGGDPKRLTDHARENGDWRPTVACIVRTYDGKYLMIRDIAIRVSRSDESVVITRPRSDFIKGGVDSDHPDRAVERELWEEARILPGSIRQKRYIGHAMVPFDRHNQGRDGYRNGKLYLFYVVDLKPKVKMAPGRDHRVLALIAVKDPWNYLTKSHENGRKAKPGVKRSILIDRRLRAILRNLKRT